MIKSSYPADSQERSRGRINGTAQGNCAPMVWHKWRDVLPALRMAKAALGLNKSRLDLLEKMFACLPGDIISTDANGRLIVFASNARLAEMTHRDSDKTITRLITELETRNLLERRTSPNGKRYARQGPDGQRVAYGLDLGPLLARMSEIQTLARAARERAEACRRLRESCSIMLKDLSERASGQDTYRLLLEDGRRILRRKPDPAELNVLHHKLAKLSDGVVPDGNITQTETVSTPKPPESGTDKIRGCAPQNTCHKDTSPIPIDKTLSSTSKDDRRSVPLTPDLVEQRLPRVAGFGRQIKGSLRDLVNGLLSYLGIGQGLWRKSIEIHGFQESSLVLMVIYERQKQIKHAPGYFAKIIADDTHGPYAGSRLMTSLVGV